MDSLDFFQKRNAQKYAVIGANRIDESALRQNGRPSIRWLTIRGQDRNNPILLILHGGPGDVTNPWGYAYFYEWEKYFNGCAMGPTRGGIGFWKNQANRSAPTNHHRSNGCKMASKSPSTYALT